MKNRKHRIWLLIGIVAAAAVTIMLAFASCGQPPTGITLEEAIAIARQAVEDDGVMSLDERDTEHEEETAYWHIYFPFTSHDILGGEPHVQVAKADGEVLDLYYTQ
jgi:hypothetical protein